MSVHGVRLVNDEEIPRALMFCLKHGYNASDLSAESLASNVFERVRRRGTTRNFLWTGRVSLVRDSRTRRENMKSLKLALRVAFLTAPKHLCLCANRIIPLSW